MCGVLGILAPVGSRPSVAEAHAARMRDLMAHRGPDGVGLRVTDNVLLAHRRLAVIDLSPAAAQPFVSADGQFSIVYNGELYNDPELRAELARAGAVFRTRADTETVLAAASRWWEESLPRLRGMYAFAVVDHQRRRALLARDPLGIKPLYYWTGQAVGPDGPQRELVFASEIPPILAHPAVSARPDLPMVSGYLTTIRTTLDDRTLFEGVRTLRPGEWLDVDLSSPDLPARSGRVGVGRAGAADPAAALADAVERHLVSDVPVCCLLSGGLDSSILTMLACRRKRPMQTYCAGADVPVVDPSAPGSDFQYARLVAGALGTDHREARVDRALFADRWREMVARQEIPLSTPNEVAINEVARRLRADGMVVTLSGEGADELFAGYDAPLLEALRFESARPPGESDADWADAAATHHLDSAAWIPRSAKQAVLSPDAHRGIEGDARLHGWYREVLRSARGGADGPLRPHLRFLRSVNLTGLLLRLDSASMLESVEGRTPFADAVIAAAAEATPEGDLFMPDAARASAQSKVILRRAFRGDLPAEVVARPKASFPLLVEDWIADAAGAMLESAWLREILSEAAIETVAAQPARLWRVAWPCVNLALWCRRWWG